MSVLQSVMDYSSNGILVINRDGIVTNLNKKAKDILGLSASTEHAHAAGRLEVGDIIALIDACIGKDDGALSVDDLKKLGISNEKIHPSDAILAVGVYGQGKIPPLFKYVHSKHMGTKLQLNETYQGIPLRLCLDVQNLRADITVEEDVYSIPVLYSIGHMVAIDPATKKAKFFQNRGYHIRSESVGALLHGSPYSAKGPGIETDIVGMELTKILSNTRIREDCEAVMTGQIDHIMRIQYETNQAVIAAALYPVLEDGARTGVVLRFRDILDIRDSIAERNIAVINSEWKRRELMGNAVRGNYDGLGANMRGSTAFTAMRQYAYKLAQMDCNLTIMGESGTGKSYLAREINRVQPRKGPFIQVDCTTISQTLFESEMFGYVGGAFTGADAKGKAGFFEKANGGTILLDEIGDIPLSIQAKLLNVVQNKTIYRVGSTTPIQVDVRILAATNRNLKDAVKSGTFRSDLYYRLNAFCIELPPLRECRSDLHLIIENTLSRICEKYKIENKSFSGEAFRKLISYAWPGNIRELENVIEHAVLFSDSDIIYPEFIELEDSSASSGTLADYLFLQEGKYIEQVLTKNGFDRRKTIQELGLSKSSFYNKLKDHCIRMED